jgi:cell wall-associated NlpC family hydrolase
MLRGGTWLRRRLTTLAIIATSLGVVCAGGTTSYAVGSHAGQAGGQGDAGSGPKPFPVIVPAVARHAPAVRWSDLTPADAWAKAAIDLVGGTYTWMRDFPANPDGTFPFRPDMVETRKYLARAVVKAFAPGAVPDPSLAFTDLQPTQTFYRWASIAVKLGWLRRSKDGRFMPDKAVTMTTVHRVLVSALGMRSVAATIDGLHTRDGFRFDTPKNLGTTLLGMRLGLRYNSANEANDVGPATPMPRAQVAYSIYKAATLPAWVVPWVADQYRSLVLPKMGPNRRAIVQWGLDYVGYPYVWGGEWGLPTPEPGALGGQPVPGFDCSGLAWWALRANDGRAWSVAPPRPYAGWKLPQRSSADMARFGILRFDQLLPGDLAFYDGNGDGTVDHVDVYIGRGYALDSSSSPAGVTIMWVGDGWYRDHFVHGRRVLPRNGS